MYPRLFLVLVLAGKSSKSSKASMAAKSPDERFRDDLEAEYDNIMGTIRQMTTPKSKKVRVQRECLKCGCSHIEFAEADWVSPKDALAAAEWLANRGAGRPGTVEVQAERVAPVYKLEWVKPEDGPVAA